MSTTLTIALSKGRIFKETLPLLKHAGIEPVDDLATTRKLKLNALFVDVPANPEGKKRARDRPIQAPLFRVFCVFRG